MVQKIGLDKSSPYKNGGFLPLFNIFVGANGRSPLPFEPCPKKESESTEAHFAKAGCE